MRFKGWLENDIYFHGSPQQFNQFDYTFVGKGHGQEGPGFYFTSSEEDAAKYIGPQGKLYKAQIKLNKPVPLQGRVNRKQIENLIKNAPDLDDTLTDWDENPNVAFANAVNSVMSRQLGPHDAFQQVWYDFYNRNGADAIYLQNMVKLGYDGVIVPKSGGVTHLIAFNPAIIRFSNA